MCWLLMTADCSEDQQRQEMCLDEAPLCQAGTPADIGSQVCANTDQYRVYQVSGPWVGTRHLENIWSGGFSLILKPSYKSKPESYVLHSQISVLWSQLLINGSQYKELALFCSGLKILPKLKQAKGKGWIIEECFTGFSKNQGTFLSYLNCPNL